LLRRCSATCDHLDAGEVARIHFAATKQIFLIYVPGRRLPDREALVRCDDFPTIGMDKGPLSLPETPSSVQNRNYDMPAPSPSPALIKAAAEVAQKTGCTVEFEKATGNVRILPPSAQEVLVGRQPRDWT